MKWNMKRERIVYECWLAVFALLVTAYSLGHSRMPLWGASKTIGLLVFVMTDLLHVLLLFVGPREKNQHRALLQLLCFAAATVLYIYYCFGMKGIMRSNLYRDSIVAGTLLCLAVLVGGGRQTEKTIDTPEE